jgi:ABC-2 type transport system ATP-binding protein
VAVIEAKGLTKRFGPVLAADDLSFTVETGTITGFLGPNGAGKTTTLRMLLGLVRPDRGTATICGQPYRSMASPLRRVGAVLESAGPHPGRTARAHLRIQAMAAQVSSARVDQVLDLTGLTDAAGRRAGTFSLGMRQRLGIAAALLAEPEVLILDEPANGLDPEGVRWLRDLLRKEAAEGRTVLVSSHILAEVAQTADTVIIINHGRLVTTSSLDGLTATARPVVRVRSPRAGDLAAALAADGARATTVAPGQLEITGCSPERVAILAAERSIPIVESTSQAPTLEDVFLNLTTPDAQEPSR